MHVCNYVQKGMADVHVCSLLVSSRVLAEVQGRV